MSNGPSPFTRHPGTSTIAVFFLLLALVPFRPAGAQVGHPPGHSPFQDLPRGATWTALVGDFRGDGGALGVGPHHGLTYGLRYDIRVGGLVGLALVLSRGELERLVIDPYDSVATRVTGPVSQYVYFAGGGLQLNLTGAKTWHGVAPYIGGDFGFALSQSTPSDTSGYKFGNRLFVAPGAGVRLFLTRHLHLRLDGKVNLWKLKYPGSYAQEPAVQPGTPDQSNAVVTNGKLSKWDGSLWLQAGLGISF